MSLRTLDCSCMETFFSIMWLLSLGCNLLSLWISNCSCMEPLCWMMCLVWDWQRAGQECVWTAPRTCRWNARLEVWEGVTAWLWRHACHRSLAASWLLMAWPSAPVAFDQLQRQKTVLLSELDDQSFEPIPRNVICNTVWLLVSYGSWQAGWAFLSCASYARVFGPEMYNDIVSDFKVFDLCKLKYAKFLYALLLNGCELVLARRAHSWFELTYWTEIPLNSLILEYDYKMGYQVTCATLLFVLMIRFHNPCPITMP